MSCDTLKRSLDSICTPLKDTPNFKINPWMDPQVLLAWVQNKEYVPPVAKKQKPLPKLNANFPKLSESK